MIKWIITLSIMWLMASCVKNSRQGRIYTGDGNEADSSGLQTTANFTKDSSENYKRQKTFTDTAQANRDRIKVKTGYGVDTFPPKR